MSDTGLRSKMRRVLKLLRGEQPRHGISVGDIASLEAKIRVYKKLCEPSLLEPRVVMVVKVVDADDTPAFGGKPARKMKSDEPGCAGHEDRLAHTALARSGRSTTAEKITFDQAAYGVGGHDMDLLDQRCVRGGCREAMIAISSHVALAFAGETDRCDAKFARGLQSRQHVG